MSTPNELHAVVNEQEAQQRRRGRLLRRLALIVDDTLQERTRLASIRAVQKMLPAGNPLKEERPESLLNQVKHPWSTRPVRTQPHGRIETGRVNRPPVSLADIW